ncbi:MAG: Tropinesterase, partial [Actinoallomurus sp.]|nr:Tropinesterase [Actinoallomurus sp.]
MLGVAIAAYEQWLQDEDADLIDLLDTAMRELASTSPRRATSPPLGDMALSVERTVVSAGVRLTVRDFGGSEAPVLLLHGLPGHAGEWDATAE